MRIKEGVKIQSVGGEHIILLQGTYGVDTTKIVSLNETSLFLWSLFKEKDFTMGQIANTLVEEFGIERELAIKDAKSWVEVLEQNKLIEQ